MSSNPVGYGGVEMLNSTAVCFHGRKMMPLLPALAGALLLAAIVQPAHAARDVPDLKRLYEVSAASRFQNLVIVVHGVFGARIRRRADKQEIWPGNTSSLLFSSYETLALDINPQTLEVRSDQTEAYALFDRVGGHDYYGRIVKVLHEAGRYEAAIAGQPRTAGTHAYYVFVYDWRQDIADNAAKLDAFIEQIRRDYRMPRLKVDIVAHSMGALVTRYFIRYGKRDVLDQNTFHPDNSGAAKLRKVVLIGAPNLGSVSGLQDFLTGYKLGLGTIPTEVIATMPGSYELLPNPSRDWMITPQGRRADVKLYDVRTWKRFKWSILIRMRVRGFGTVSASLRMQRRTCMYWRDSLPDNLNVRGASIRPCPCRCKIHRCVTSYSAVIAN